MEKEKSKENKQIIQEEIKLLTFNPEAMQKEIETLKSKADVLAYENGMLQMIKTTLEIEVAGLEKRIPKKLVEKIHDFLLYIFGGHYEEYKER